MTPEGNNLENIDLVSILLHDGGCMAWLLDDSARFASDEEEAATWQLNRDLLLSLTADRPFQDLRVPPGNRPWAWWKYESGLGPEAWQDRPERYGSAFREWQYEYLKEHGLLRPGEEEQVRAFLRELEARTWRPPAPDAEAKRKDEKPEPVGSIVLEPPTQKGPAPEASSAAGAAAPEACKR